MALKSLGAIVGVVVLALVMAALAPKPKQEHSEGDGKGSSTGAAKVEPAEKPKIEDQRVGKGRVVEPGDMISVHYDVFLPDGKKVDSSRDKGAPLTFLYGGNMVIPAWDSGLKGVRAGGLRRVIAPPSLAYGEQGSEDGKIPANATLRFEIEVLKVVKPTDEPLLDPLLRGTEVDKGQADPR
jgi:peptidylprolyl isomerase